MFIANEQNRKAKQSDIEIIYRLILCHSQMSNVRQLGEFFFVKFGG
jgi:hypothetical protein